MEAADISKILIKCTSRLNWLEEAWYDWVAADELYWISQPDLAAKYVERSLRWLKRILRNPQKSEGIREHVEWLIKEIEAIGNNPDWVEKQVSALTPRFRQIFLELLVGCVVEEVKRMSVEKG